MDMTTPRELHDYDQRGRSGMHFLQQNKGGTITGVALGAGIRAPNGKAFFGVLEAAASGRKTGTTGASRNGLGWFVLLFSLVCGDLGTDRGE